MISDAWEDLPKESPLYYPTGGGRFAKRNMQTVCDERVTKLEQSCNILSREPFSGVATRNPFQTIGFSSGLVSNPLLQFPNAQCRQDQITRSRKRADRGALTHVS
jgi:hypothetical protein